MPPIRFIHTADYEPIIDTEELEVITGGDVAVRQQAENKAVEKARKFLLRQYDVDDLFTAIDEADVGTASDTRDLTLVEYSIYFTLYILYTRIAKRNVPEDRYEQYKEARQFFMDVQRDLVTPGWDQRLNEEGETDSPGLRMQSGKPLSHYY